MDKIYSYVIEYKKQAMYKKNKINKFNQEIYDLIKKNYPNIDNVLRKYNNLLKVKIRLKKRIKKMLSKGNCYFCTWTIEDRYLNYDHKRKLRDLYKKYEYIINEDYGDLNNRKHYHGIILSNVVPEQWQYGFCYFKEIKRNNINALATYIKKLTNHALKDSAEKIIYSRYK